MTSPVSTCLALLAVIGQASCLPPAAVKNVVQCANLYDQCVESSSSQAEYLNCRSGVDVTCLDKMTEDRL